MQSSCTTYLKSFVLSCFRNVEISVKGYMLKTMAEGLKLTAQTFTTDITKLSCCAA